MRTGLRVGGLAIVIGLAFVAGRVSSHPQGQPPGRAPPAEGVAADPDRPPELPPWSTQGFRDGETCLDVFAGPG